MTCTGCSKKLTNVLHGIPGLSNIKVTFVSGTAAFELDPGTERISVEDIVPLVERQTGFKLARVTSGYMHLDVLLEPTSVRHLEEASPDGFVSVEKVRGKDCYRLTYDPTLVGARDLLPPNAALAPPVSDSALTEGKKRLVNMTLAFLLSAAFTIPVVVLNWSNNPVPRQTREIMALVLATIPQMIAVPEFYAGAIKALIFSRMIEMDMLVVISITAAYFYSVVAFVLYEAGVSVKEAAFFETSSLLITLVLLGRLVAAFCRVRAVSAVSLRSLQAETTHIVQPDGATIELDARLLQFGDIIRIAPHTRIVTDVDVISGTSAVDESMLTGEANPVPKQAGDNLVAGTLNGPGVLEGRLRRLPGANSLTDIANLVENALGSKPRIQDLADKVASWFIPAIVAIAIATLIIWIVVALRVRGENAGGAIGTAITYGIAVLAISCPCALGLAVPMVLVIAGGVAARAGVVIKEADAIERGYKTTDVVFDKTGTLTMADLTVATVSTPRITDEALALTKNLVSGNKHPVSQAISLYLKAHDRLESKVDHVNSVPGAGIEAKWKSLAVKAGNPYWNSTDAEPCVRDIIEAGMTAFSVTIDGSLILAFGLHSQIRDEATAVVQALQRQNIRCHIVSGDTDKAVQGIASRVGIDANNVASRHSPAQKMEFVKQLQSDGRIVLFCGDGTNDAVAIAQANVGVQIGTASDVTNGVCDVTLLGGLEGILALLGISKRAFSRITFNFVWAAVYNVFAVLLASGAVVKFRIPPAYAGLGEIVSVCPVIAAAVSLIWGRKHV
ncbi:heavy metal translocatin [Hortaea werneckii]|nr:heavy metal translocatin [Hortaea werneckii]